MVEKGRLKILFTPTDVITPRTTLSAIREAALTVGVLRRMFVQFEEYPTELPRKSDQ